MKAWIRRYLGLDAIELQLHQQKNQLNSIQSGINAFLPGLGRAIAKLDPDYATSDLDPKKRRESDKIAEDVIDRLKAEDWARKHTTGEVP